MAAHGNGHDFEALHRTSEIVAAAANIALERRWSGTYCFKSEHWDALAFVFLPL